MRNADARFEAEEMIVSGNRATVFWVYGKMRNGQPWHLRGVDIFTVRDGKIAAKLALREGMTTNPANARPLRMPLADPSDLLGL